VRINLNEKLI